MSLFTKLGTTDEVLCCDCCGNTDLRSTVVLQHEPTGETVYFGSICAAAALHPWAHLSGKYAQFDAQSAAAEREEQTEAAA